MPSASPAAARSTQFAVAIVARWAIIDPDSPPPKVPMSATPQSFPAIADLLKRQGIWLEKRRSQHFLRRQQICAEIAELGCLTRDHVVIEVGAGLGNLTVELSARAGHVISVEMDETFAEWHEYLESSYPSIKFVYKDFLLTTFDELLEGETRRPVGVGNLPYQITSEILFRFVNAERTFDRLVFMVQKEVAERIAAGPGSRASGALTYKIAMRYKAEIGLMVPASEFLPPPKVDSAVLVLTPLPHALFHSPEERLRVYTMFDRLFAYRRKTVANGLIMGQLVPDRVAAVAALQAAGIDEVRRPETLSIEESLALARVLAERA